MKKINLLLSIFILMPNILAIKEEKLEVGNITTLERIKNIENNLTKVTKSHFGTDISIKVVDLKTLDNENLISRIRIWKDIYGIAEDLIAKVNNTDLTTELDKIYKSINLIFDSLIKLSKSKKLPFETGILLNNINKELKNIDDIKKRVKSIRLNGAENLAAKELLFTIANLTEQIVNKIIQNYLPSKTEVINNIDNAYKMVIKNTNLNNGIDQQKIYIWFSLDDKIKIWKKYVSNKDLEYSLQFIMTFFEQTIIKLKKPFDWEANIDSSYNFPDKFLEIKSNISKNKNYESSKINNDAAEIIKKLINTAELFIKKIQTDLIPSKQELLKKIDGIFDPIKHYDLTLYGINPGKSISIKNILNRIQLFVYFSESKELPEKISTIILNLKEITNKINDLSINKNVYLKAQNVVGKKITEISNIIKTNVLEPIKSVTTFRQGPKDAKEVLLHLEEKYEQLLKQLKEQWSDAAKKYAATIIN